MHIGVVLPQIAADWSEVLADARHAEEAGADSVWVVDHLLGFPPHKGILEAWVLLSALASATERVQLGAQVFCQSFRNPSLVAKMASTLDRVSGGRLRMLIGAGWFEDEYHAFGYDFPPAGTRVGELRDAVRILKAMMSSTEPVTYEGQHYRVKDVINAPGPIQTPLPIEIGGIRDRMLEIVAEEADGWNCPAIALGELDDRIETLRLLCDKSGRSIDELRLSVQIACGVGDEEAAAKAPVAMFNPEQGLVGTVEQAAHRAGSLLEKGIEGFHVVVPRGERGHECLRRLIEDVRPRVTS